MMHTGVMADTHNRNWIRITFSNEQSLDLRCSILYVEFLGNGATAEQLAKHLDISRDAARLPLQRAARVGLIARMGVGRYRAIRQSPPHTKGRESANGTEPHAKTASPC